MAFIALLDGLGLLVLGPRAWTWLALGLVIGTAGLWWGTERLWGRFLRFDFQRQESNGSLTTSTYTFHITGMTCDHRARTAEDALNALPGVWAEVSYEEGIARVSAPAEVGVERLLERIEAKGFKAGLSA